MINRQVKELYFTRHLVEALGYWDPLIEYSDRPDVIAVFDGLRVGIEVTELPCDEEAAQKGSRLRWEEAKKAGRPIKIRMQCGAI
jgi:hypothetical protein